MKKRVFSILLMACMMLMLMPTLVSAGEADGFLYEIVDGDMKTVAIAQMANKDATTAVIPATIEGLPVTVIKDFAFSNCPNLQSVTIPEGVISIGKGAFNQCGSLQSVTIPSSVTSIDDVAFARCGSLQSVSISSGVEYISSNAFYEDTSLSEIVVDKNNPYYRSENGVLFTKADFMLYTYPIGKSDASYTIPNGVTGIGKYAFRKCQNLKNVNIPEGVILIGEDAFSECKNLESVIIPNSVTDIDPSAFANCWGLKSVSMSDNATAIGDQAFAWCYGLQGITLPNCMDSIGAEAFYGCNDLKTIYYIGTKEQWDGVMGNGKDAIADKVKCINVTLPKDLTYDKTAKEVTITGEDPELGNIAVKYYDRDGKKLSQAPVDVGTYVVKMDIAGSDIVVCHFTISQAQNSFVRDLSLDDWVYCSTPATPVAEAKFGTPTFRYAESENGTYTAEKPTKAGTYWVKATVAETDNYTGLEAKKEFKIYTVPFRDVTKNDWFYGDVTYAYGNGLMIGTGATTFHPDMTTTRGMIVTILYRLEEEPALSKGCPFVDVERGYYYEKAITWAAENEIVLGYGGNLFGPEDCITREQIVTILYRYAQYKHINTEVDKNVNIFGYNDAQSISAYALPAMQWAFGAKIMQGNENCLTPQDNATRAQVAAILHRFCENFLK